MITFDYNLDTAWSPKLDQIDLATAPPEVLRYDLFLGDIYIRDREAGTELSAAWGWVPVLDFALSLPIILEKLKAGEVAQLEFTESDAILEFRREGDVVEIVANYSPVVLRSTWSEFRDQARVFTRRVIQELCTAHMRLAANPEIRVHLAP